MDFGTALILPEDGIQIRVMQDGGDTNGSPVFQSR